MVRDVELASQAEHETTDAELASKAKRGDIDAFGELVERFKERAYMIALGFVGTFILPGGVVNGLIGQAKIKAQELLAEQAESTEPAGVEGGG